MDKNNTETEVWSRFCLGEQAAFDFLFADYYRYLFKIAYTILRDEAPAKDAVQEFWIRLWQRREQLEIKGSLKPYLQRVMVNLCLEQLRKQQRSPFTDRIPEQLTENREMERAELKTALESAINKLPEQCRLIFRMSRVEEMSHKAIAEQLELSPKTVENQIGKALKLLRISLASWMKLLLPAIANLFSMF
jgi:RNA polymerase sigma-70 factor, ECF subfamily